MNFCKNCRYFTDYHCLHEKSHKIDKVTGTDYYRSANSMRGAYGSCSQEGVLFETKPPKISWLLRLAYRLSK